jgi:hypothetical protein
MQRILKMCLPHRYIPFLLDESHSSQAEAMLKTDQYILTEM